MVRAVSFALLVLVAVSVVYVHGHDLTSPEKEAVTEVAAQLLRVACAPLVSPVSPVHTTKRNSELINSLLGINRFMNDAGRR
ncbi:hypothetical protein Pcinc_016066 [Petrolisthes cinctipes]|uniref:Uncharacterized protein n=1 Tax=Petrolisthes cinctipes TaxID=88211 RepID=A0AAE1FT03_PETCI|nr:hypothetical protein Pcinc_016066 [Petrolisthes cinctipes]